MGCKSNSGDTVEATAIKTLFSDHATSGALAFSSTKVNLVLNLIGFWRQEDSETGFLGTAIDSFVLQWLTRLT